MTPPASTLAASDIRVVTAGGIAAYRDVVRDGMPVAPVRAGRTTAPSPAYPFVLSTGAFDELVERLTEGRGATPVHLSQEVRIGRAVTPGERITVSVGVLAARREPKGSRLALRCVILGEDGATAAELTTGVLLAGAEGPVSFGDMPAPSRPEPAADAPAHVVRREIPSATVRRYADASGDHNPIHLDDDAARHSGFPGAIVHGMCVMATVCEEAIDRFADGDTERVRGFGGRFASPVSPRHALEITFRERGDGAGTVFTAATPDGPAIKAGWMDIAPAAATATDGSPR